MTKLNALIVAFAGALLSVACYSGRGNIDLESQPAQADDGAETPDASTTTVEPAQTIEPSRTFGFADTQVVCAKCDADLLAAKANGVKMALTRLVENIGDSLPLKTPVVVHASDDAICSSAEFLARNGGNYLSGEVRYLNGVRNICTYDVESSFFRGPEEMPRPFTVMEAADLRYQVLVVHEAGHAWFVSRVTSKENPYMNYSLEEPFVNAMSQRITDPAADMCEYSSNWTDRTSLEVGLCEAGFTAEMLFPSFRAIAAAAVDKGSGLTASEVANVIELAVSTDVKPIQVVGAFADAGLL